MMLRDGDPERVRPEVTHGGAAMEEDLFGFLKFDQY